MACGKEEHYTDLVHPEADRLAVFLNGFQNKWFAFIGLLKEYFKGHKTICSLNVVLHSLEKYDNMQTKQDAVYHISYFWHYFSVLLHLIYSN